jgi:tryptophan-rich sensory protein
MDGDGIIVFLGFFLACAAAATPGLILRPGDWYRNLAKPSWCPPAWLFGPVWLVLYVSIAVAGWLIWLEAGAEGAAPALAVYALQLVLNGLWSTVFFGLSRPGLAFIEIMGLWISILATIAIFYPIDKIAAFILIPYLVWVTFAALLNLRIWLLNRARSTEELCRTRSGGRSLGRGNYI